MFAIVWYTQTQFGGMSSIGGRAHLLIIGQRPLNKKSRKISEQKGNVTVRMSLWSKNDIGMILVIVPALREFGRGIAGL